MDRAVCPLDHEWENSSFSELYGRSVVIKGTTPVMLALLALASEAVGWLGGNALPIVAWTGTLIAIPASLTAIVMSLYLGSKSGLALGVLAALGAAPVTLLSMFWYVCLFRQQCL